MCLCTYSVCAQCYVWHMVWCGGQSPTFGSGFPPSTMGSRDQGCQAWAKCFYPLRYLDPLHFNKSLLAYFKILKLGEEYSLIKSTLPILVFVGFFPHSLSSRGKILFFKFVLLPACWLYVYLRKKMWIPMFSRFIKDRIVYLLLGACDLLYFFWHVENTLIYKKNSVTRSCVLKFTQQALSWLAFTTAAGCRPHMQRDFIHK